MSEASYEDETKGIVRETVIKSKEAEEYWRNKIHVEVLKLTMAVVADNPYDTREELHSKVIDKIDSVILGDSNA